MPRSHCSRAWQAEAASDGRLSGKGARHTDRIAVSRGRVLARFGRQPQFSVQVGEQWQRPQTPARAIPVNVEIASAVAPRSSAIVLLGAAKKNIARPAEHAHQSTNPPPDPSPIVQPLESVERASKRAEDGAYLAVLSALHDQRFAEARARAKSCEALEVVP